MKKRWNCCETKNHKRGYFCQKDPPIVKSSQKKHFFEQKYFFPSARLQRHRKLTSKVFLPFLRGGGRGGQPQKERHTKHSNSGGEERGSTREQAGGDAHRKNGCCSAIKHGRILDSLTRRVSKNLRVIFCFVSIRPSPPVLCFSQLLISPLFASRSPRSLGVNFVNFSGSLCVEKYRV